MVALSWCLSCRPLAACQQSLCTLFMRQCFCCLLWLIVAEKALATEGARAFMLMPFVSMHMNAKARDVTSIFEEIILFYNKVLAVKQIFA